MLISPYFWFLRVNLAYVYLFNIFLSITIPISNLKKSENCNFNRCKKFFCLKQSFIRSESCRKSPPYLLDLDLEWFIVFISMHNCTLFSLRSQINSLFAATYKFNFYSKIEARRFEPSTLSMKPKTPMSYDTLDRSTTEARF